MRRLLKLFSDLPIARKLLLASVIPVLTVILLSIVTYRSVENFSEDESELNTLYLSQRLAAEYLRLVVDLETGFRGFVITKHEKYLYPYRTAQDHIQAVGISLDEQVRRYDEQRAILSSVRTLVSQFTNEKEALIEAMKAGRQEEAKRYIEEGRGRMIMIQIREEMARFDRARQQTLNTLLSRLSQDRSTMLSVILGGGTLALCLMLLALHLIARSITGPLVSLAKVVSSSPAGMAPTVPVMDRKDEIGNLTQVIHTMSSQLRAHLAIVQKSEAELRSVNRDLSASEAKYRSLVDLAPFGIFSTKGFDVTFSNRYNRILAGLTLMETTIRMPSGNGSIPRTANGSSPNLPEPCRNANPMRPCFGFSMENGTIRKVLSRRIPLGTGARPDRRLSRIQYRHHCLGRYAAATESGRTLGDLRASCRRHRPRDSQSPRRYRIHRRALAGRIRSFRRETGGSRHYLERDPPARPYRQSDHRLCASAGSRADQWAVDGIIEEVLKLLDTRLETQRITVTRFCSPTLAAYADRDQIKQVLLNLCHNSLDAMPAGGDLRISAGQLGPRGKQPASLSRWPTPAPASAKKHLAQVFQPFFTTGKRHGTGLGLAICRNIAEAHGGDMTLTSEPGQGTKARLWLPFRPAQDSAGTLA